MGVDLAEEEPFGPYLVYERLGVGGMATVHRALERGIEGFERIVALKRLLPHLAEDASFIKSFVREAKLASLLNHVNIVQIFELGRVGTEYFISMEYIDGRDIRRILRHARKVTGPPPLHVTVGLVLQLCEALDYAHTKSDENGHPLGLVHRDVSPSNLLVTQAGHLKVIDFGIAKAQSQQLRTQTGRVKGKLAYMAPEAITGKELDARSDVFAAGVILHELLTARPLFASKNEYQTLLKVQKGDILPPSTFNQACPPELDAICLRALERDPDARFASAADMRDELHALRRALNLQTGNRDIAQWLTWAFSIEAPSSSFGAVGSREHSESFDARQMRRTPAPRRHADDEEAVEIAWGGGDGPEENNAPVVLDDVPDVSDRHEHSVAARLAFASALEDDIPQSTPSHGPGSRAMARLRDELDAIAELPAPAPTVPHRKISVPMPAGSRAQTATQQTLLPRATPVPQRNTPVPAPMTARARTTGPLPTTRATPPPPPSGSYPATHARSVTELPLPPPADDDDEKRTGGRRFQPDTLDPEHEDHANARFKPPTSPPGELITARPSTASFSEIAPPQPVKRTSDVTIGESMIQRRSPRRTWLLLVGLGAAGAAATAVTLIATRGNDQVGAVKSSSSEAGAATLTPERRVGTVKFMIEPPDAEIRLVEKQLEHAGSPWTTQLEPGVHQIQIEREGYKSWLTSIELSANETQTLRVVLEPMSLEKAVLAEATLVVTSTPPGLEAFLDGRMLGVTPIKAQIKPGPHALTLQQNGQEVWRQDLNAKASANYEFNPVMTEDKRRERAQRAIATTERTERGDRADRDRADRTNRADAPDATPAPAPAAPDAAPQLAPEKPEKPVEKPAELAPVPTPPAPPPPKPTPPPVVPAPARPSGPVLVPPSAVRRISGDMPTLGKTKRAEVPPVVAAKVCIDTSGKVTDVDMITKLERLTSMDLGHAINTWRYAPYKQAGVAVPACFVVSFRVQ